MTKEEFKQIRKAMKLNRVELGKKLGGYTARAVYSWEYGDRRVPPAVAKLMELYK